MLLVLVMVTVIAAGCEVGSIKDSGYTLSAEQQEMLGISQEEFDALPEEARAELQEMLEDLAAEHAAANTQSDPAEPTEPINAEEDVQKYLEDLPALP